MAHGRWQPRVEQYEFGSTFEQTCSGDLCPSCGELASWIFIGRAPGHWTRFLVEHSDNVWDFTLDEFGCKIPPLRWGAAVKALADQRSWNGWRQPRPAASVACYKRRMTRSWRRTAGIIIAAARRSG